MYSHCRDGGWILGNTVGAGPIGLAVLLTAQFYSPAAVLMIDLDDNRLRVLSMK
jgi:threonine dehydrogenase-like Zn-dependent dehydrogenase